MMPEEEGSLVLRKVKVAAVMSMTPTFAKNVEVNILADVLRDNVTVMLKKTVLGLNVEQYDFTTYDSWWDMFKEKYMPRWYWLPRWLRTYRRRSHQISTQVIYPMLMDKIPYKDLNHYLNFEHQWEFVDDTGNAVDPDGGKDDEE